MPSKNCQEGGIVFGGKWKLFPVDEKNWELCHLHENTRGNNKGTVQWNRLGRYYSYNTFDLAVQYAADVELKAKASEQAMELWDALETYRDIVADLKADVIAALGEVA